VDNLMSTEHRLWNVVMWKVGEYSSLTTNSAIRSCAHIQEDVPSVFPSFFPCPYKPIQRPLFGLTPTSPTHLSLSRHTYI
jgi:hypothetical protein